MELTASATALSRRIVRPSPARMILSMNDTSQLSLPGMPRPIVGGVPACSRSAPARLSGEYGKHRINSPIGWTAPLYGPAPDGRRPRCPRPIWVGTGSGVRQDRGMRKHDSVASRNFAIEEAGLIVRPWRPADADQVFRACQDPLILRWTSLPNPYLRHHAEGYVGELSKSGWESGTAAPMGVFDPAGRLLGAMGLISLQ